MTGYEFCKRPMESRPVPHAFKLLLLIAAFWPAVGHAEPSFRCKGNLSPAETLICADADLGELDRTLAQAFADLLKGASEKERLSLIHKQQVWLVERDVDCGLPSRPTDFELLDKPDPKACLVAAYQWRVQSLPNLEPDLDQLAGQVAFPASRYLYLPRLQESHDDSLCAKFLAALTEDFKSVHGDGPLSDEQPEFPAGTD